MSLFNPILVFNYKKKLFIIMIYFKYGKIELYNISVASR